MGDTLTEVPNNCRTPTGELMFDLNKEIPWSPATKENKHPTGAWMFDLNEEIPVSPSTLEDKSTASSGLNKEVPRSSSLTSLGLLNKYGNRMKRPNQYLQNGMRNDEVGNLNGRKTLSTVDLVKVAASKFMNALSLCSGDISKLIHPLDGGHFDPFSEVSEDVELLLYLLTSAAKVADNQFRDARKYLNMCNHMASRSGSPVQRIVHYFAEALGDRIDRETGIASSDGLESIKRWVSQMREDVTIRQASILPHQKELPFFITVEPAAMQVILDNMVSERRIHLIDLHIRTGLHWTILMQALAVRCECPVEMLTITAVGTISIEMVEATGRRLSSFAESMSLPFSFKIVMMLDEKDLSEDLFELEAGDAVGIYSAVLLWKIKERPNLITVLKNLCPIVMVVSEVETYTDLPDFMDQFSEALFYYSASFDAFEAYLDRDDPYRMSLEGYYYRGGIQNVVRFEREDRETFHMKIDGWREFFERFGMVGKEMSMSSLYQARLMLEKYASGSSCTLDMDGKCMLLGWKGTPLLSLSAWKFLQLKDRRVRATGYDS